MLETVVVQESCDLIGNPQLNLDEWAASLRSTCGGDHEVIDRILLPVGLWDCSIRDQDPMRACGRGS
jgi:hypothetical protein